MDKLRLRVLVWLALGRYLPLFDPSTLSIKDGVVCGMATPLGQTVARWLRMEERPDCCDAARRAE